MMWLILLGFAAVLYQLYGRVRQLEGQIAELELLPYAPPEPERQPAAAKVLTRQPEIAAPPFEPEAEAATATEPLPEFVPKPEPEPDYSVVDDGAEAGRFALLGRKFDFEDLFGRRLPIWAGGVTLALAGIFLVRFSIEAGLLTPPVRVALSFAFGLALIVAAEAAYRFEERVRDPRVRQALAGAGLATLYAGFYLAGTVYGLIGSAGAFVGLAAVTAAAIGLSWRFGLPCAVLGLVGGFAAPALVASDDANIPLLTLYLSLVTGGLAWTGGRQKRAWLGYLALAAGFLWGGLLLIGGLAEGGDLVALGLFIALLGVGLPLLLAGDPQQRVTRVAAAVISSLQMAALVETAGSGPLTWGLYLLLGAGLAALGWRDARVREGSAVAAALGLWLLVAWDQPPPGEFAAVAGGFAAVFLLVPLAHVWRGRARPLDLWQLSLAAPALAAVTYWLFGEWNLAAVEPGMAGVAAALALIPALAGLRQWRSGNDETLLVIPLASAALLGFAALLVSSPEWLAPVAAAAIAAVLLALLARRREEPLVLLCWAAVVGALGWLLVTPLGNERELARLGGGTMETDLAQALLRWAAVLIPFAALALLDERQSQRRTAEAIAALLAYGLIAQVLPGDWLAWTAALGAKAIALAWRERGAAAWALGAVAGLWALVPLAEWCVAGMQAMAGEPMMIAGELGIADALLRLAPLALAAGVGWWTLRGSGKSGERALLVIALGLATVTTHVLFKQVLAIGDVERFQQFGMAERTFWQALLTGAGLVLLRLAGGEKAGGPASALVGLSLAHFTLFTLMLHNPLLAPQAVGPLPLVNWLLPAYGIALACVLALKRLRPERLAVPDAAFDGAAMALIALFALSALRQAFAGSILTVPEVSQTEDLLRSLLGIVLALGFLWWGSRSGKRSWRVGSLVLMLIAVSKVFLVDAAGLEGLLRIASFMALGFSLIGIGWVYSRQLSRRAG
jgi:uncharacterized membrane protein